MITAGSPIRRILADETGLTATAFYKRAHAWFAQRGVTIERVLIDNGGCYRSRQWCEAMRTTGPRHKRTRPYRPQTNGKVERFHRTLLEEWAYIRPWASQAQRTKAHKGFLHYYNQHRTHSALKRSTPASTIRYNLCETRT